MKPSHHIDFSRAPLRGIFGEVAAETGTTRQNVWQRYRLGNQETIRLVDQKIRERQSSMKEARNGSRRR